MTHSNIKKFFAGAGLIGSVAIVGAIASKPVSAQSDRRATAYTAVLSALPNTNGSGRATLLLSGDQRVLRVNIQASGLDAGGPHLSHIHGRSANGEPIDSTCPTIAQDTDEDGFVELAEGAVTYGPILIDFMNIDPDEDGNINFSKTIRLTGEENILPLTDRHIVVHGMNVGTAGAGTDGEVNGTPEYKVLLPVLCGEITQSANPGDAMRFRQSRD